MTETGGVRSCLSAFFMMRLVAVGVAIAIAFASVGVRAIKDRLIDSGPPAAWDARVLDIVAFVERERGHEFAHPVAIEFLAPDEYAKRTGEDIRDQDLVADEYAVRVGELADAAGLAVDYDPYEAQATITSSGTLGLYDLFTDEIWVRGAELTPDVRATLAHELTHALQVQHFAEELDGAQSLAARAMVEADADRVERAYVEAMSDADRAAVERLQAPDVASVQAFESVPWAVVATFEAPYVLGPRLVQDAYDAGGNAAVDALLIDPPTEEVLISPWLAGSDQTEVAPEIEAPSGTEAIDPARALGMWETLVMLDAWLPWSEARAALDGWGGGAYIGYAASGGPACFAMTAQFDRDPQPFADAVRHWASASGSDASPVIDGRRVSFRACARGHDAVAPPTPEIGPLEAVLIEASAVDAASTAGSPTDDQVAAATCLARRLIDDPEAGPLLLVEEWTAAQEAAFERARSAAAPTCGPVG